MKVMILAAGFGRRMQQLTQHTPKPLLQVKGRALIEYLILRLVSCGISDVIINVHYHAQKIIDHLGDGSRYGAKIQYSHENDTILGTGGGVANALTLLGEDPFLLISGDVFTDYDFSRLVDYQLSGLAHLVLVNNPEYKLQGDFALQDGMLVESGLKFTYANIGVVSPALFRGQDKGASYCLAPLFFDAIGVGKVSGEFYNGWWFNVGTQEILASLNQFDAIPQLGGCPKGG